MNILHLDEYSVKTKVVSDRVLESCFVLVEERISLQDPLIDLSQLQHVVRGTKHRNTIGKKKIWFEISCEIFSNLPQNQGVDTW